MTVTDARGQRLRRADATAPVWRKPGTWSAGRREFALFVSDQYQQAETDVGDVRVVSWYRPGEKCPGRAAAEYAGPRLRIYSDLFGPYPYAELDVVARPYRVPRYGAPRLFELGCCRPARTPTSLSFASRTKQRINGGTNLVGNDPVNEPWLDEGLAERMPPISILSGPRAASAERLAARRWQAAREFTCDRGLMLWVDQPVEAFQGNYETIVYGKAALFHHLLQAGRGRGRFI